MVTRLVLPLMVLPHAMRLQLPQAGTECAVLTKKRHIIRKRNKLSNDTGFSANDNCDSRDKINQTQSFKCLFEEFYESTRLTSQKKSFFCSTL